MIPKHSIDKVVDHANIEEVIGQFVNLKKKGTNHIGLCPFHDEKTPSFAVSPSKGIFKCFGCGKSGSVIGFLMEHEQFSYADALRYLAGFYNLELEEETSEDELPKEDRERIYAAVNYAADFFSDKLHNSDEGKKLALTYLQERGFKPGTINNYHLGYSPDSWDAFLQSARKVGFEIEILEKAGLVSQAKNGNYIDRFRGRLMFPVYSLAGRVLGFGGRVLGNKEKEAKYINTQETEIYDKSRALFGLYHAKKPINQQEECYVVEGYTDVLAMQQQGFENTVSVSGTSLTEQHVRQLHRLTSRLVFIFDSDEAGHKAAERSIDLALKQNMDVWLVELPEGEDPGSFALSKSAEEVGEFLQIERKNFLNYKADKTSEKAGHTDKATQISGIIQSISAIPDPVRRELLIQELGKKFNLAEQTLYQELNRQVFKRRREQKKEKQSQEAQAEAPPQTEEKPPEALKQLNAGKETERWIFGWLMLYGDRPLDDERTIASMLIEQLQKVNIAEPLHEKIFNIYLSWLEKGSVPTLQEFIHHPEKEIQHIASEFGAITDRKTSENWYKKHEILIVDPEENYTEEVLRTLRHFMYKKVDELLNENREKIKTAEKEKDEVALEEHIEVQQYLQDMKNQYAKDLGATVL